MPAAQGLNTSVCRRVALKAGRASRLDSPTQGAVPGAGHRTVNRQYAQLTSHPAGGKWHAKAFARRLITPPRPSDTDASNLPSTPRRSKLRRHPEHRRVMTAKGISLFEALRQRGA
jgi:hypothetical protein